MWLSKAPTIVDFKYFPGHSGQEETSEARETELLRRTAQI